MSTDKVIIVSGDSHANDVKLLGTFSDFNDALLDIIDTDGVWRAGRRGAIGDVDERLQQMDRDATAAEFVYFGHP
jgi:hypothetical protein